MVSVAHTESLIRVVYVPLSLRYKGGDLAIILVSGGAEMS